MYSDHRDRRDDRRDRDRRDRDRERERERESRDRYHGSSRHAESSRKNKRSRSPSPHSRSNHRDRDRDRDRDDRDRPRDSERDRNRDRDSHKRERRRFTEDPNQSSSSNPTSNSTSNPMISSIDHSSSTSTASKPFSLPLRPASASSTSVVPPTSSSSSSFLPTKPSSTLPTIGSPNPQGSTSTLPTSSSLGSPNPSSSASTNEDPKAKAKRERLQAWRKEQETKKALEEARLRALNVAAAFGGSKTAPTTINATGLKGLGTSKVDLKSKLGSSQMNDDLEDSNNSKKSIKRFVLPPMDPLMKPGRGINSTLEGDVEPDLENDDEEEEGRGVDENVNDEDDIMKTMRERMNERREVGNDANGSISGGDVEMKDVEVKEETQEEEEEDELDAFMNDVKSQVKLVDAEDSKRLGNGNPSKKRSLATVLGGDEEDGIEEDEELRRRNQENSDDELGEANTEDIYRLASKSIKKKEIQSVDHSQVNYEDFRKDFYHEPFEVAELSEEKAEELRLEMDAIQVRGKDCPKPLTKWSHCGLPSHCLDVIKKLGYEKPTSIQSQAIPAIMSGRDVIGVAKTGSGKTMAFLLPMFRHIKDQRRVENLEGPIGIIMTPTRELAVQIYRESKPFLKVLGLRAVCVYGGAPISEQIAEMKKTAEIVVATPGRMIDLLTANSGRVTNLRRVTYLVLDEADRMFDMGFEPQVMKIINNIRPDRQTVLFSATFPKQMEALARKVAKVKPLEITVGGRSVVAKEIEQIVEVREEETKFNRLLEILGTTYNEDADARTLIFVDRQESADDLLKDLMSKGYATMSLHGGKDQIDRDSTINDFKAGIVPIVTATSVAARGLDVKQLKLVINYDCPNHMEDYVHRAGRTGRAGNKGTCVTFITPQQDRYAKDIISALKASKVQVPEALDQLYETFKKKLADGKVQNAGSGFGGKGLERLESDREKTLRAQQSAYGEAGGDIPNNNEDDGQKKDSLNDDIKIHKGPAPSDDQLSKYGDMKIEVKRGAAPAESRDNKVKASTTTTEENASDSPSKTKNEESKSSGGTDSPLPSNLPVGANATKLAQALAKIQAAAAEKKKNQEKLQEERESRKPKDPDATDFHAIVPINDFPQRARWRVTNKETMVMLIETTGASITNKGIFYEKGKEPNEGDPPKLQLLIESNNEGMVEHAVREIKRILLEATQAALEAEQRNPSAAGRYQVV